MKFLFLILLIFLIPSSYGIGFGLSPNRVIIKENWTMQQGKIIVFNPSNQSFKIDVNYDHSKLKVIPPEIIKPNSQDYINYTIISKLPFTSSLKISAKFSTIQLIQDVKFMIGIQKTKKRNLFSGIILTISIIILGSFVFKKINKDNKAYS